jgi:hypothetical protein
MLVLLQPKTMLNAYSVALVMIQYARGFDEPSPSQIPVMSAVSVVRLEAVVEIFWSDWMCRNYSVWWVAFFGQHCRHRECHWWRWNWADSLLTSFLGE